MESCGLPCGQLAASNCHGLVADNSYLQKVPSGMKLLVAWACWRSIVKRLQKMVGGCKRQGKDRFLSRIHGAELWCSVQFVTREIMMLNTQTEWTCW